MLRSIPCSLIAALLTIGIAGVCHAQRDGGANETQAQETTAGGGTGETAISDGFDTGASLDRTERRGRDTGTFVGAAAPTTGDFSAVNADGNPLGGANSRLNQNPFTNFFNQLNRGANQFSNQQNQQNQIRIPLKLGFAKPPRPATEPVMSRNLTSSIQARFNRIERFGPDVQVALDGNTAVLSGLVADEDTRRLAARMVMLEPGVTDVRNELQVATFRSESLPNPD